MTFLYFVICNLSLNGDKVENKDMTVHIRSESQVYFSNVFSL